MEDGLTLVDAAGNDICETATMLSYSLLGCQVSAAAYVDEQLSVESTGTGAVYACGSTDVT